MDCVAIASSHAVLDLHDLRRDLAKSLDQGFKFPHKLKITIIPNHHLNLCLERTLLLGDFLILDPVNFKVSLLL